MAMISNLIEIVESNIATNIDWWKKTLTMSMQGVLSGIGQSLGFMALLIWLELIDFNLYSVIIYVVFGILVGFVYPCLIRVSSAILEKLFAWYKWNIIIHLIRDLLLIIMVFYFFVNIFNPLLFNKELQQRDLIFITLSVGIITMMVNLFARSFYLEKEKIQLERENFALTMTRERTRLARDVHDTLGHTMTLVLTLLEASQLSCEKDMSKAKQYLTEAIQISRAGISEFRNSIRGVVPEALDNVSLTITLQKMIASFQPSGMKVDFTFHGPVDHLGPDYSVVIYRLCQEALTNSFRHGKAEEVSIILRVDAERIRLFIFDNGSGCKMIKPGIGLAGMKQRIEELRGKISFGSDGERGFAIHAEIPCYN